MDSTDDDMIASRETMEAAILDMRNKLEWEEPHAQELTVRREVLIELYQVYEEAVAFIDRVTT